jgi:hypothetical protein
MAEHHNASSLGIDRSDAVISDSYKSSVFLLLLITFWGMRWHIAVQNIWNTFAIGYLEIFPHTGEPRIGVRGSSGIQKDISKTFETGFRPSPEWRSEVIISMDRSLASHCPIREHSFYRFWTKVEGSTRKE